MCTEVNLPLARQVCFEFKIIEKEYFFKQRNENEMRLVRRHWNELGHICGGFDLSDP